MASRKKSRDDETWRLAFTRHCPCYGHPFSVTLGRYCGGYAIGECGRCLANWAVRL